MNIFKVLANGDGRINEANISSFLAYLLNPNADHGLNYEFLKRFTSSSFDEANFKYEKFEYEIFLEQAFKEGEKSKQIVDLVIVCYSIDKGSRNESLVKEFINNTKVVEKIFLIENKTTSNSLNPGQLVRQFDSTRSELESDMHDKIHSIFITPKEQKIIDEFSKSNLSNASHIYWKSLEEEDESVYSFLVDILQQEANGTIEPLSEYTLHTIKAFNQFIDSDFKSQKDEEKERKHDYSYTNECIRLNEESQIEKKLKELKEELESKDSSLKISEPIMKRVCEPSLLLEYKGLGISLFAGQKSRNTIIIFYVVATSRDLLDKVAYNLNAQVRKANYGDAAYFKEDWMKKQLPISDTDIIYNAIIKAQKSIDKGIG
jgi:PD-(D/E)XK nuclease superfamily protein